MPKWACHHHRSEFFCRHECARERVDEACFDDGAHSAAAEGEIFDGFFFDGACDVRAYMEGDAVACLHAAQDGTEAFSDELAAYRL